ncbi:MAG: succinylglutamate desuccinylase/aspartoacylase family protein, partial [Acidobacteria bacterium]|nr:succinylglutamate desuccinylase/aspartoacylase family protein [Acidobacteriota bacterium]
MRERRLLLSTCMQSQVSVSESVDVAVFGRETDRLERRRIDRDRHIIAAHTQRRIGPTLIVVGGIHGNEPAGVEAIRRVMPAVEAVKDKLHGRVYFIQGNTRAHGHRYVDMDLNRAWTREDMANVATAELCRKSEGLDLTELDQLFDSILVTARNEVYVIDLHSTSATGVPFATIGDTLRNRHFAQDFPVRILLGIEERLEGTMLEHLNNAGCVTLGFEGGSHNAPETIDNHVAIIWLALVNSGILWEEDAPRLEVYRDRLTATYTGAKIVEVRHREPVVPGEEFEMKPGYNNFDPVIKGDVVAGSKFGDIKTPESGMIVMPLYQKLGEDGFFIVRGVAKFWLWLSEVLRRMKIQDLVEYLPGVKADPHNRETLTINTHVARFFPLQIFHLLG